MCFLKVKSNTSLSCSIHGVGEIIDDFSWTLRTKNQDERTSSQQVIVPNSGNGLRSYRVDVIVPLNASPALSLYACSSNSRVPAVCTKEATILVDHGTKIPNGLSPILLEKNLDENVTMKCGRGPTFLFVWLKDNTDDDPIAYGVSQSAIERTNEMNREGFILEHDNSLTINAVDERSEGVYTCLYSQDGTTTSYVSYVVTIQGKTYLTI